MKSFSNTNHSSTRRIAAAIGIAMLSSWITATLRAQSEGDQRAVMFERTGYVSLADKDIPEFHKRTEITDIQNRSIKGDWIAIDRQNKTVIFRRTDGKEFDIGMAGLTSRDRRYAELETGILWQLDPPPADIGIIQEDILGFESMDDKHVHFHVVNVKDPSVPMRRFYRIDLLTEKDRALIKQKTGRELVIPPNPPLGQNNAGLKYNPRLIFGHQVPAFEPGYYPATMDLMRKTYSPGEMVDAVRTRTMTGAFIHQYYQSTFDEARADEKKGTRSLAEILKIIGEEPSPATEQKSIKPIIAKHKLSLFEEKSPRDPTQPERFIKGDRSILAQPGVPIDGELQAFHFMCQYLHVTANKPKIPLSVLLENTKQGFSGMSYTSNGERVVFPPEQRRKIYHSPDVMDGIEITHGFKTWRIFVLPRNLHYHRRDEAVRLFFQHLTGELIRQHIRDGKPAYARKPSAKTDNREHGTQLVVTGFKAEAGKPLMFEAISIKGSIFGNDPHTGEYEVTETTLPQTELDSMSAIFLEAI